MVSILFRLQHERAALTSLITDRKTHRTFPARTFNFCRHDAPRSAARTSAVLATTGTRVQLTSNYWSIKWTCWPWLTSQNNIILQYDEMFPYHSTERRVHLGERWVACIAALAARGEDHCVWGSSSGNACVSRESRKESSEKWAIMWLVPDWRGTILLSIPYFAIFIRYTLNKKKNGVSEQHKTINSTGLCFCPVCDTSMFSQCWEIILQNTIISLETERYADGEFIPRRRPWLNAYVQQNSHETTLAYLCRNSIHVTIWLHLLCVQNSAFLWWSLLPQNWVSRHYATDLSPDLTQG